jgi:hypothetical protein
MRGAGQVLSSNKPNRIGPQVQEGWEVTGMTNESGIWAVSHQAGHAMLPLKHPHFSPPSQNTATAPHSRR